MSETIFTTPSIDLSGVTLPSFTVPRRELVKGLNWRVMPRDFWVITTTVQSGQREFIFTAAGVQPAEKGRVRLFGRDIEDTGRAGWMEERLKVGILLETGGRVFGGMTVAESVSLPLRYHRDLAFETVADEIAGLLAAMELGRYAGSTPGRLSPSWQQRTALARALVLRPQVLFLERPLANLEWAHTRWWLDFLGRLAKGSAVPGMAPVTPIVVTDHADRWVGLGRQFAVLRRDDWRVVDGPATLDDSWIDPGAD